MKTYAVWTKDISPQLQARLMTCFTKSFDQEKSDRYFKWKFRDNPFGDSLHVYAEIDQRVVASRVFWRMDAADRKAYQCVDTAVLENFRGKGLFSQTIDIAKRLLARELIYNLPNAKSGPLYLRSGWEVIRASGLIRVANWWTLKNTPTINWGKDALSWRFRNHPSSQYFQRCHGGYTYIFARRRENFYILLGKTPHNLNLSERAPSFFFSYDNAIGGCPVWRSLPLMYYANQGTPKVHRYLLDMA